MKGGFVILPSLREAGTVEACGTPLAYLAWLAWPCEDQKAHRDLCFLGGMASAAKSANVPRPEFPKQMKGKKPERVDNKVNSAFEIIYRKRWRAVSMLAWRLEQGFTQVEAASRLLEWSIEGTERYGDWATRGIYVTPDADETLSAIRGRVWRESVPVLPMAWGFFAANGWLNGGNPRTNKLDILTDPKWVPIAIEMANLMAEKVAEMHPETRLILPQIT